MAKKVPLDGLTFDKMLVEPTTATSVTEGGIHIPEVSQDREPLRWGVVRLKGPGARDEKGEYHHIKNIEVGDMVLYLEASGVKWKSIDGNFVILREVEVQGVRHKE